MLRQNQGHQQAGSDPLLETFLTAAVMDVFRNSTMFGGVLVALTATLISDVANQDPSTTVAYLLRYIIVCPGVSFGAKPQVNLRVLLSSH